MMKFKPNKLSYSTVLAFGTVALLSAATEIQAQALEEIVVTAQRRGQTLQEVPISIEVHTGESLIRDGIRDLNALADFSPGIVVELDQSQGGANAYIRGFGTSGRNLNSVQAAPTFVDNVYQSRISMSLLAYMDLDRVEVLKGPQPVFFGQNATAGAFSIISKKPTPEWEGYVMAEGGFFGKPNSFREIGNYKLAAAYGGPITDTVGIRVAGAYETSDGHMRDIVSQRPVGYYNSMAGRVIMDWKPTDNFTVQAKFEMGNLSQDPESLHLCRTEGPARYNRSDNPSQVNINDPTKQGNEQSIWLPWPQGSGTDIPHEPLGECYASNAAAPREAVAHPWWVRSDGADTGAIDIRRVLDEYTRDFLGTSRLGGLPREDLKPTATYLNMSYTLDNGINLNWLTGYQDYLRNVMRPNRYLPFVENVHHREEDLTQWNSELRIASPGGGRFEWMGGLYWQDENINGFMHSFNSGLRQGYRRNIIEQNARWLSAFGTFTFNITDQFAIDIGGRYSDAKIITDANGLDGGQFIFDSMPCQANVATDWLGPEFVADMNPATCTPHANAVRLNPADAHFLIRSDVRPGGGIDLDNLYYLSWQGNHTRRTPPNWRSPLNAPVGLQFLPGARAATDGNHVGLDSSDKGFDPQVVLRYAAGNDTNFYAKWAEAWKVGGVNTGVGGMPRNPLDIMFASEKARIFEFGVKGLYWEGRASYELIAFQMDFTDLQTGTITPDPDDPTKIVNAGEQRVRGIEWGTQVLVSDQLRVSLMGMFMDSQMTSFPNAGCTAFELANAAATGCDPVTRTIDRTGERSPYSPKWSLVAGLDYTLPSGDQHAWDVGIKASYTDSYFRDPLSFSKVTTMPRGGDMNLRIGYGDIAGDWDLSLAVNNLFEHRQQYNPDQDVSPSGIGGGRLTANTVRTFRLQYLRNF